MGVAQVFLPPLLPIPRLLSASPPALLASVFRRRPLLQRPHTPVAPSPSLLLTWRFGKLGFCSRPTMDQSPERSAAGAVGGKSEVVKTKEADLLQAFYAIPNIDKAWTSSSRAGSGGVDVVVAMSQVNLHANAKRSFISTVYIPDVAREAADYHWSPFPFELNGALLIVPSPSGTKLLIVRKADPAVKDGASSAVKLEIWGPGQLLKELFVPPSVHGSVYAKIS